MSDCPLCPLSPPPPPLPPPVLAEMLQADLITGEECKRTSDISDVVNIRRGKSPEVMLRTADVLIRHGFRKESILPVGRQSKPSSICLCYAVPSCLLSQCMGRSEESSVCGGSCHPHDALVITLQYLMK